MAMSLLVQREAMARLTMLPVLGLPMTLVWGVVQLANLQILLDMNEYDPILHAGATPDDWH
jgi:hypothetical protein